MKFALSQNARSMKIGGVTLLGNLCGGSFLGLTDAGESLLQRIQQGEDIHPEELKQPLQETISFGLSEGIFVQEGTEYPGNSVPSVESAYLHVTDRCNFHCIGCYSYSRERSSARDLSTTDMKRILEALGQQKLQSLLISGGEPFLRDDLPELLAYAKQIGIPKIVIGTNGSLVGPELAEALNGLADMVMVAVDGYSPEGPVFLRDRGSSEKALAAVRLLRDAGVPVSILPTIHRKNYLSVSKYMQLAEAMQVPISFSILTCDPSVHPFHAYVLTGEEFRQMVCSAAATNDPLPIDDVPTDLTRLAFKGSCGMGGRLISIDSKGNVFPCHMLMDESHRLGNVLEAPLASILGGEGAKACRDCTVESLPQCKTCTYRYFCGGGCKARRFLFTGRMDGAEPYCEAYQLNFRRLDDVFSDMKQQAK